MGNKVESKIGNKGESKMGKKGESTMGKIGRLLKVLTLGGIVGFIGGLLVAPQKGEQTREKLKDALDKGKSKFDELKEELGTKDE